jgi:hypothetical protein
VDTDAAQYPAFELISPFVLAFNFLGCLYGNDMWWYEITEVMDMNIEKKSFLKALGFRREVAIVEGCRCPLCTERVDEDEFRDEGFIKEFENSGLCQGCQETVFGYKVAW